MDTYILPRLPKILFLLSRKQKFNSIILLFFILGSLFFEIFSIGLFLPIIDAISNNSIDSSGIDIFNIIHLEIPLKTFLWVALGVYLVKASYMVCLIHFQHHFVYDLQYTISNRVIKASMHSDLEKILDSNSSETINSVISESTVFAITIVNLLIATFTELLISIGLIVFVFNYDFIGAITLGGILSFFGLVFFRFTNKINKTLGYKRIDIESKRINVLTELFGVIKEIILSRNKEFFFSRFSNISYQYKSIMSVNSTMIQLPRVFIDLIIFIAFTSIIIIGISSKQLNENFFSTLSIFALVAIRLTPSFNRVIGNLQSIKFNLRVVDSLYERLLYYKSVKEKSIQFGIQKSIELRDVSFSYKDSHQVVIHNANILFEVGKIYGVIGESGSGKTTLINIISGLLSPVNGKILIDGIELDTFSDSWRSNISYMAQDFYILSGTVEQNIALGVQENEIDYLKVNNSIKAANLDYKKLKYPFKIKEQGKNLSGGQKQRIALARCFYKGSSVIILDEATSALDSVTEASIMKDITKQKDDKLIIIITHNDSLLRHCDKVLQITNGFVSEKLT